MKKTRKSRKTKIVPFFKYLAVVIFIITIITLGLFKFIDVVPGEYFLVMSLLLGLIATIFAVLLLSKSPKKRVVGTIFSLLYLVILVLVIVYELNTIGFLKKIGFQNYKTENYSVIAFKSSNYQNIQDLNKKKIGSMTFNSVGLKDAKAKLEDKIKVSFTTYDDLFQLKDEFVNHKTDAILIEDAMLAMIKEDDPDFESSIEVIYNFSLDIETEDIAHEVDITKDAFSIYVSGIDTYGSVSSVSRSDVNMVITVNPKNHQILITSIPRDYYVELATKNAKDKLTHAGIYGIDISVGTIEKLLDTKINYYVKVNFTSVIKIVNALGGVDVYSEYSFTSQDGYYYKKGYNSVKGKEALSFVRERKSFAGGDRVRIENQARMVEALVNKAISPAIITKYNSLLSALSNAFITNLDDEKITEFIKMQIADNPKWTIENYSLNGRDAMDYTYSYKSVKSYVMVPDEDTVKEAKAKIKKVLSN